MDKIGRYELQAELGSGSMGRVFRAFDPDIGRPLAIKVLLHELRLNDEYRERFLREARGAGVLSHPNIVTVYDVGDAQSGPYPGPYIVMEYVEGGTLADVIKRGQKLPAELVVDIGIQLARALGFAHGHGIVHRDVKPSNIMVLKDGRTIKVADFGICRIDTGDATRRTRMGDVLGTPNYMSPEQVLGSNVDARSDLFSAGVVLYELLAGALPFDGDTFVTVAVKISNAEPVSLDKLRPDLPLSLRRVVSHALQKQPQHRFQSGQEMADALVAVARELAAERERSRARPRRVPLGLKWAGAMSLLVVVTMGLTAALIHQRQHAALFEQVTHYGSSLVKFMATQNAVPLLSEDWVAVEVFVQETTRRQDFGYLRVVDRGGTVRGSNDTAQVGVPYAAPPLVPLATRDEGVQVSSARAADGRAVLDFATPVLFQGREVGRVHLGIFEQPLAAVSRLAMGLLALLTVVTAVAVAIGSWFLARRMAAPAHVLRNSLQELGKGRYDYRIGEQRKDEFGELYAAFDSAAAAIQQRHQPPAPTIDPATLSATLSNTMPGALSGSQQATLSATAAGAQQAAAPAPAPADADSGDRKPAGPAVVG